MYLPTWQIKEHQAQHIWVQLLHLVAEEEGAGTERAHYCIQQVEHLLRGPAILWHTQLDPHKLHLWTSPQEQGTVSPQPAQRAAPLSYSRTHLQR